MIIILTEKLYITIMGRFARLFNFLLNLTILVGYIYKSHKITLMKLNTKSRYAVMALADLAKFSSQNPVSLRDISLRQNISILYLEQIFLKLKKNNVVRSVRGINGGYVLNKNPEDIKIAEIFLALDEKFKTIACKKDIKKICTGKSVKCITHNLWDELEIYINSFFEKKKLSDLINKHQNRI